MSIAWGPLADGTWEQSKAKRILASFLLLSFIGSVFVALSTQIRAPDSTSDPLCLLPGLVLIGAKKVSGSASHLIVSILAVAAGLATCLGLTRLCSILEIEQRNIKWLVWALFLGTAYWPCVLSHEGIVSLSHFLQLLFIVLAMIEALTKSRAYWCGFLLGLAILCRPTALYAGFFLIVALFQKGVSNKALQSITFLSVVLGAVVLSLVWDNFSNLPHDYSFYLAYIPGNFIRLLLQGFTIAFSPPAYLSSWHAAVDTSLTFSSPFVFFCFRARWSKPLLRASFFSLGMTLLHGLLSEHNFTKPCFAQFTGLDLIPILVPLIALGFRHACPDLWRPVVLYSLVFNAVAYFWIPATSQLYDHFIQV